jgi:hypothetical protein
MQNFGCQNDRGQLAAGRNIPANRPLAEPLLLSRLFSAQARVRKIEPLFRTIQLTNPGSYNYNSVQTRPLLFQPRCGRRLFDDNGLVQLVCQILARAYRMSRKALKICDLLYEKIRTRGPRGRLGLCKSYNKRIVLYVLATQAAMDQLDSPMTITRTSMTLVWVSPVRSRPPVASKK